MSGATSFDLSAIRTDATSYAATFRDLIGITDSSSIIKVATVADLPNAANGDIAVVTNQYEFGFFVFSNANLSSRVTADPDKGLYAAPPSDATGASGAWVRRVENNTYDLDWVLRGDATNVTAVVNRFLKQISWAKVIAPNREMTITRAAVGTVNAGSSSFFNGITGGIYIDNPGVHLIGHGYGTFFNCEGARMNAIMVRASHCRISRLRSGNCRGQLETSESAGVCFQPSNFVHVNTGSGNGFDITDLIIYDCDFPDCDSGVTGSPEVEFKAVGDPPFYRSSKLVVDTCRITGNSRQGVEFFYCNDSVMRNCYFEGADRGVNTYSRGCRVIASQNIQVINNPIWRGFTDADTGYIAVEVSTGGWYGLASQYEMSSDVMISGNHFHGFGRHVQVEDARGEVVIENNIFTNDHGTNGIQAININSQGPRNPAGNQTNEVNKLYTANLSVRNNTGTGQAVFCSIPGTIWQGVIADNKFTSNESSSVNLVNVDLPSSHPLERVNMLVIEDNIAHLNPAATTRPIQIAGLKAGNQVFIDGNKMTPTAGGFISHSGLGSVTQENNYSNIELPGTLWSDSFDPPPPPIFGQPNV